MSGASYSAFDLGLPTYSNYPVGAFFNTGSVGDSSGDGGILGSLGDTSFTFNGLTCKYLGTAELPNTSNYIGFIGVYRVSSTNYYYLFVPGGSNTAPADQVTLVTPPGPQNTGEWNLNTNTVGCFLSGTNLRTPTGERPVETLRAGDPVLTADGRTLPVRWVGRTRVSRISADPIRLLPIRITAGALADNIPARDLLLSPGHAVLVDGVLIHAAALVNGTTILRDHAAPVVFTYYHVELDTHALLLAEGAPAESFLDGAEDMAFTNWADRVPPDAAEELSYPRAKALRQIPPATRTRLAARAALTTSSPAPACGHAAPGPAWSPPPIPAPA